MSVSNPHALSLVRDEIRRWRDDPVDFFLTLLGVETLWEKQIKILEAVRDHPRVAVAACHDSSKTFTAARLAWWWVLCHPPAKVVTTAPTDRQVRQLLWSEIRSAHRDARLLLPGEVKLTDWQFPGSPDWFMTGFATTPDRAAEHATRFQGYHSPHLLLVFDEASGIARPIWDAAEGILTSGHSRFLAIGNPTDPSSEFARAYRSPDWHSIRIDAYETPNVKAGRVVLPFLVTPEWVDQMRRKYGQDSPVFLSKVRGLFPDQADDGLISLRWVQEAFGRRGEGSPSAPVSMGVDVARFGSDWTAIYVVQGPRILHAEARNGQNTMWTAGRVVRLMADHRVPAGNVSVDDTGVGGGVTDRLRELGHRVRGENFGGSAVEKPEVYYDRRSELWWALRDWIRDGACLVDAPARARDMLREDLTAPRYEQRSDGRLKLEAKSELRKRLGRSPDDGDALALALAARKAIRRKRSRGIRGYPGLRYSAGLAPPFPPPPRAPWYGGVGPRWP